MNDEIIEPEPRSDADLQSDADVFSDDAWEPNGQVDADGKADGEATTAPGLDRLIHYLKDSRGFDFAGYKRAGLERRLVKRMTAVGVASFDDYVDYLEVHPDELNALFNAILINATGFFRDPGAWDLLAQQVVPDLIERRKSASTIRIWSAGCATGQETYSIAMVLARALGIEAFSRRVKIYATDLDDEALAYARQATYTAKEVAGVPGDLLSKYFEPSGGNYTFLKEARRSVIFGRNNLISDAPISRIDLLLCRNTLMYFNADAQGRILSSMHFALADGGVLFLGKAEMLLTHDTLFTPLDLKRRLFTKVAHALPRTRPVVSGMANRNDDNASAPDDHALIVDGAFDLSPVAQIALNARGAISIANEQARRLFGTSAHNVGRHVHVHETVLARKFDCIHAVLERVHSERRTVQVSGCELTRGSDDSLLLDVVASPMLDEQSALRGVHLSFLDVTAVRRTQQELQQATRELGAAYEELQSTSEELEITNEELQSTVDELETTNEELQSTVDELETTNEELQSTNEELQGMNDALRIRTGDLGRLNLHFESILASMRSAVIVLDLEMRVHVWSVRAAEMWGLRSEEVLDKHLLNLDIGLPLEKLTLAIRAGIAGEQEHQQLTIAATNRRGESIACVVRISRLTQADQTQGVVLLMDEQD